MNREYYSACSGNYLCSHKTHEDTLCTSERDYCMFLLEQAGYHVVMFYLTNIILDEDSQDIGNGQ